MSEENKQEQQGRETSRFKSLIDMSEPYSLGRMLDIDVDLASGDTILTEAMIKSYDEDEINAAIQRWSSYAVSLDENDVVDRAYLAIAHSKIDQLDLVRMLYLQVFGDEDQSENIRVLESEMYGHYNPDLFRAGLKQKISLLEALTIDDPELQAARADLLDDLESYLKDAPESEATLERPEEATITAVNEWLREQYSESISLIERYDGDTLNAVQLKEVFDQSIENTPVMRDAGWVVTIVERKKDAVSVFPNTKEIIVPSQCVRKKDVAIALIVHEVFGHALKSANAESLGNEVGASGTATYPDHEESFLVVLEQCVKGVYDGDRGLNPYIAIGLVETEGVSPDKVAQIAISIKQIEDSVDGLTPEKIAKADSAAGANRLKRVFAGMTDVDPGIAHRADINYLHGQNGSWKILNQLVRAGELDQGMKWLLSAKFNPFDKIDRELVNSFTPMPASLYELLENEEALVA